MAVRSGGGAKSIAAMFNKMHSSAMAEKAAYVVQRLAYSSKNVDELFASKSVDAILQALVGGSGSQAATIAAFATLANTAEHVRYLASIGVVDEVLKKALGAPTDLKQLSGAMDLVIAVERHGYSQLELISKGAVDVALHLLKGCGNDAKMATKALNVLLSLAGTAQGRAKLIAKVVLYSLTYCRPPRSTVTR